MNNKPELNFKELFEKSTEEEINKTVESQLEPNGTICGFPIIIRKLEKTSEELEEESECIRLKFHQSFGVTLKEKFKYFYYLAIPKKSNEYLKKLFVEDLDETRVLIEIPREHIECISEFIQLLQIKS